MIDLLVYKVYTRDCGLSSFLKKGTLKWPNEIKVNHNWLYVKNPSV